MLQAGLSTGYRSRLLPADVLLGEGVHGAALTMYTYCPNCLVIFEVSAVQLSYAAGKVRCGECRQVYIATDYLFDDLAEARATLDALTNPEVEEGEAAQPVDHVRLPDEEGEAEELPSAATPGVVGWNQQRFTTGNLLSGVGILALLVLLGGQWIWFNRDALAADPDWRPSLEQFCGVTGCDLPLRTDLKQLVITNRDVRQHPTVKQALLINATFENRADFDQPYPVFEVSFTDVSGRPFAVRRFRPAEYLADTVSLKQGMSAGAPVQVVLELMDPGREAVSFQFSFL